MKHGAVLAAAAFAVIAAQSCQCDESLSSVNSKMVVTCDGKDCDSYDFGQVPVGIEKKASFVVENRGDFNLEINAMALGKGVAAFTVDALESLQGAQGGKLVIAPSKSVGFSAAFKPSKPAPPEDEDAVVFATNDPTKASYSFGLSGTGIKASITAEPPAIDFGKVDVKTRVEAKVTVANTGTDTLHVSAVEYKDKEASKAGDIFIDGTVDVPTALKPGASIDFTLVYLPKDIGTDEGSITVDSDSKDIPKLTIPVTGEGVAPLLVITPQTLDYGSVAKGSSTDLTSKISNEGNKDLILYAIDFRPKTSAYFSFVNPVATPATVGAGKSVDVTVRYAPTDRSDDELNNEVMVHCNDTALLETDQDAHFVARIVLSGRTHSPKMDATGGTSFQISCGLPFDPNNPQCVASCLTDCCCMQGSLEVKNIGDEVLLINGITLANTQGNGFTLLWNKTTPYQIQPNGVEEVMVQFTPTAFGSYGADLTIDSNDPLNPVQQAGIAGSATKKR